MQLCLFGFGCCTFFGHPDPTLILCQIPGLKFGHFEQVKYHEFEDSVLSRSKCVRVYCITQKKYVKRKEKIVEEKAPNLQSLLQNYVSVLLFLVNFCQEFDLIYFFIDLLP